MTSENFEGNHTGWCDNVTDGPGGRKGGGCLERKSAEGWEGGELKLSSDLSHRKDSGEEKAFHTERKALQKEAVKQMQGTEGKSVRLELGEPWQEWC